MSDLRGNRELSSAFDDRLNTRLLILRWPRDPDPGLHEAVARVTGFQQPSDAPTVLGSGSNAQLHWSGLISGGVVTLLEQLGPLLASRRLDVLAADARVELFVPARGPVVVFRPCEVPMTLDRRDFEERLRMLDCGADAARVFRPDAPDAVGQLLGHGKAGARGELVDRSAQVMMVGGIADEIDLERLRGADATLVERYDPDGILEESWVSRQAGAWRTDLIAPGTCRIPGEDFDDSLCWRVAQWEWSEDEDDEQAGEWQLRAQAEATASEVADLLLGALRRWVRRATEEGIELCRAMQEGGEDDVIDAERRLREQLRMLDD